MDKNQLIKNIKQTYFPIFFINKNQLNFTYVLQSCLLGFLNLIQQNIICTTMKGYIYILDFFCCCTSKSKAKSKAIQTLFACSTNSKIQECDNVYLSCVLILYTISMQLKITFPERIPRRRYNMRCDSYNRVNRN